eukprot:m.11336 g.11336  ORF g.11336 m.11336 type:complete len:103 (-) comp7648_c0_seq1:65-373(-)
MLACKIATPSTAHAPAVLAGNYLLVTGRAVRTAANVVLSSKSAARVEHAKIAVTTVSVAVVRTMGANVATLTVPANLHSATPYLVFVAKLILTTGVDEHKRF